jgi:hypothetical protein
MLEFESEWVSELVNEWERESEYEEKSASIDYIYYNVILKLVK